MHARRLPPISPSPLQRAENEARRATGQEQLPEEDPSLPFFKPLQDTRAKDPLDMLLYSVSD